MNIADKESFYRSIYRALKPGGRLALYDPIRGSNQPVIYPTPWAQDEAVSFVVSEDEIKKLLAGAGFTIHSFADKTDIAAEWFQKQAERQRMPMPQPLSLPAILGPELGPAIANFSRNVVEGRLRVVQIIAGKL